MLAFLSSLTPAGLGEIIGGVLGGLGFGVSSYALYKTRHPQLHEFATKEELNQLRSKHDAFEDRIRAQIREGEQRTHKRLDILASKMDESIGLQKADSRILQSLLSHLINPNSCHHDHQS